MRAPRLRTWVAALIVLAMAGVAWWLLRPLPLSGPWRAQIVDTESGQPLEGVIVLALWDRRSFGWPHADRNYHDVDELVSDTDGRIVIPARVTTGRHPLERIVGPIVTMFKPGYGQWTFKGTPAPLAEDAIAARQRSTENWQRFAREGVVIMLPLVQTREARLEVLDRIMPSPEVPRDKVPRLAAAYTEERVRLGFKSR